VTAPARNIITRWIFGEENPPRTAPSEQSSAAALGEKEMKYLYDMWDIHVLRHTKVWASLTVSPGAGCKKLITVNH